MKRDKVDAQSPTYNDIIPVLAPVGHTMAKVSASLTGYVK